MKRNGAGALAPTSPCRRNTDLMSEETHEVVVPIAGPGLGWGLVPVGIATAVPAAKAVHLLASLIGSWPAHSAADVAVAFAVLAVALVIGQPLRLIGRKGTATFGPDGLRVEYPALMDGVWKVRRDDIDHIMIGRATVSALGAERLVPLGGNANMAVTLKHASPRVPVRGRYFVPALFSSGTIVMPNTTVSAFAFRTDAARLEPLKRQIEVVLGLAEPPTYLATSDVAPTDGKTTPQS